MEPQDYTRQTLDYLGLVAGTYQEIEISQAIDEMFSSNSPDQSVRTGKCS
ncbi:MAG: DUF4277 domain-containing protein [Saprospiraceae bacterium]|nr:DUF4277 domain-containing protein [Saprospiraceae bacterium]